MAGNGRTGPARWAVALCGALVGLAIVPAVASAALVRSTGTQVTYEAHSGELNDVQMSVTGTESGARWLNVGHRNSTTLTFEPAECEQVPGVLEVRCPLTGSSFTIAAVLGDRDDELRIGTTLGFASSATVDGGAGADDLVSSTTRVELSGGAGDDRLASDGLARQLGGGAAVATLHVDRIGTDELSGRRGSRAGAATAPRAGCVPRHSRGSAGRPTRCRRGR